jgi:hypothetical protein
VSITTTESLARSRLVCQRCSSEITVMGATDEAGRTIGACCARPSVRAMLASCGAGPETCLPLAGTFLATDAFSHLLEPTPQAVKVLAALRRGGVRQATPEAIAEVLAGDPSLALVQRQLRDDGIAVGPDAPIPPGQPRPIGSHRVTRG